MTGSLLMTVCMTKHLPASRIKPVFERPISHCPFLTKLLVFEKPMDCLFLPTLTLPLGFVLRSLIRGYCYAALVIRTRSLAVEIFLLSSPVGSANLLLCIPSCKALIFIALMNAFLPAG